MLSHRKGSSLNTGEGCADFQEEVLLIAVPVGAPFDDLDGVVHAFDDAGVEAVPTAGQDSMQVGLELGREVGQCRDAAALGLLQPMVPGFPGPGWMAVEPMISGRAPV